MSSRPIALSDDQMSAILAASHPLSPDARGPFLEACARALAGLPEVGDGIVHRVVVQVQRQFFDPPQDGTTNFDIGHRTPRVTKLRAAAPIETDRAQRPRSSRARV
jgi:hypothetical protein